VFYILAPYRYIHPAGIQSDYLLFLRYLNILLHTNILAETMFLRRMKNIDFKLFSNEILTKLAVKLDSRSHLNSRSKDKLWPLLVQTANLFNWWPQSWIDIKLSGRAELNRYQTFGSSRVESISNFRVEQNWIDIKFSGRAKLNRYQIFGSSRVESISNFRVEKHWIDIKLSGWGTRVARFLLLQLTKTG
jgi:hypothetical protein